MTSNKGQTRKREREMKNLKILGLAAVAAMALLAFGAGTASAGSVLCKNGVSTTGCTEDYGSGTVIEALLTSSTVFQTTGGTILDECGGSTLKVTTSNTGGATQNVKGKIVDVVNGEGKTVVTGLTWSLCTKTTKTLVPGELEVEWVSGSDNGTLRAKETQITIGGIFGESCIYGPGAGTTLGTLIGTNPASISISTYLSLVTGGGLCPNQARWTATYMVTRVGEQLSVPLYVARQ
jgi:hypothetical protein